MTTDDLLAREDRAWLAFVDSFAAVPEGRREDEGVVPGWSVKDLLWHCGYWTGYVADLFERAARGDDPPPDRDWEAFNAVIVDDGRAMTWDECIVRTEENRARLRAAVPTVPEPGDELLEDLAGETWEHYEEHAAEIRVFAATTSG